ncbi:MAG: pilus assembly protein TadE [Sphingomonadales bacterium 32-68-7]|nr:MAG: pilus assembly protein TadE [Sphingomonadales bacterium 12-68-11]OYX08620.1 MAG: pilus assembly protein TadE [Sphingomonadales bacterium 32-68-7]
MLDALRRDESGISMVEFGLSLPMLVALGMYGIEIANMTTTNMQISQLALAVADNASRLGQTDNSAVSPTIAESEIAAVMSGALRQGSGLKVQQKGRIILSSLEKHTNGRQYIHWQRCTGDLVRVSAYGNDTTNNGLTGIAWDGMGQPGRKVAANTGQAVMFVEVVYEYQPLFGTMFVSGREFRHEAAFIVRDDRNLASTSGTNTLTC